MTKIRTIKTPKRKEKYNYVIILNKFTVINSDTIQTKNLYNDLGKDNILIINKRMKTYEFHNFLKDEYSYKIKRFYKPEKIYIKHEHDIIYLKLKISKYIHKIYKFEKEG